MPDKSHFIPKQLVNSAAENRPGHPYSSSTMRELHRIIDSNRNTSETTPEYNRGGAHRRDEIQIQNYFDGKTEWNKLSPGAQRRYDEDRGACKDIKEDVKLIAPAVHEEFVKFFNKGNKHYHRDEK